MVTSLSRVVGRQSIVGEVRWELEGFRDLGSEENVLLVILRGGLLLIFVWPIVRGDKK